MPRVLSSLAALGFSAILLAPSSVAAQTYQGGVRGLIKDANGVIPGADVTVKPVPVQSARQQQQSDPHLPPPPGGGR